MSNQELEIPENPVMMQTNRDYRLASLSGWVLNFKANEPCRVPPSCYEEAVAVGAIIVEGEDDPVMTDGTKERPHADIHSSVAEAARLEQEAKIETIENAIVALYHESDMTNFKADGGPKALAVIAKLPANTPKPNAGEIQEVYDDMTTDVRFADLMGG